jgi:hypothetical protein
MKIASNLILFSFIIISIISCEKKEKSFYIHYGYIYNSNTNKPFSNTEFKLFYRRSLTLKEDELFFKTDSLGYFYVKTDNSRATYPQMTWPSYFEGAAYYGPPPFRSGNNSTIYSENNNQITYWDTIFTTPYY